MKLLELLQQLIDHVTAVRGSPLIQELVAPISPSAGRLVSTVGTLYLYELTLPSGLSKDHHPFEDMPVTILPSDGTEPTEGFVMRSREGMVMVQTFDSLGKKVASATIVPD